MLKNSFRRKLPETRAKSISLRFHSQFRTFEVGQKFQYQGVGHEIGL